MHQQINGSRTPMVECGAKSSNGTVRTNGTAYCHKENLVGGSVSYMNVDSICDHASGLLQNISQKSASFAQDIRTV